jgi:hypothetical protein
MSDIRLELSSPVAIGRFRDMAEAVLKTHGALSDDVRAFLERKAAEMGIHRLDVERVLVETRELPAVKAAETVAKQKAEDEQAAAQQHCQLRQALRVSDNERLRLAVVSKQSTEQQDRLRQALLVSDKERRELAVVSKRSTEQQDRLSQDLRRLTLILEQSEREVRDLRQRVSEAEAIREHVTATALIVSQEGDGQYRTIGEALQAAEPGSFILVQPGTYYEGLVIDRNVAIVGNTPSGNVIVESSQAACINMQTDRALAVGLTLRYTAGANGGECYGGECFGVNIRRGQLVVAGCDITSDSWSCVGILGEKASTILRRCCIHDGKFGVVGAFNSQGLIEDCDIFGNTSLGVGIGKGGNLTVRRCRIHNGHTGIMIAHTGQVLVENCGIFGNVQDGLLIKEGGNPTVCRCWINRNNGVAVRVAQSGRGTIEDCDLTDNAQGAWNIEAGGVVERRGNRE